jgi:transposase
MRADPKSPEDIERLRQLVRQADDAMQRDRYRVVLIALEGMGDRSELFRDQIAAVVGRPRQFVDQWVGRYRRGGIDLLVPKKNKGMACKLSPDEQRQLCQMLDAGPTPEEALAAYNGPILREKIEKIFGKVYTLDGVYKLLHRLGYNDLMPRTTHPDTDPAELEEFKKTNCRIESLSSRKNTRTNAC